MTVTRSCANATVAQVAYANGDGGRFTVHVNLVHERGGWRVFDVAEAPPHIALPAPLSRSPGGC